MNRRFPRCLDGIRRGLAAIVASALFLPAVGIAEEVEHGHHKNEIAGFVGFTHERRENGLALGAEYKRLITTICEQEPNWLPPVRTCFSEPIWW